jgi:hypothetical protein
MGAMERPSRDPSFVAACFTALLAWLASSPALARPAMAALLVVHLSTWLGTSTPTGWQAFCGRSKAPTGLALNAAVSGLKRRF